MSTDVVVKQQGALAISGEELLAVLKSSLYPGAKDESVRMVLHYCAAAKLDPMQKPVHIVPMDVPTGRKDSDGWDITEKRDIVMPGIGLYRTQAARNGTYAGQSEPEFGQDITESFGSGDKAVTVTYPTWCRVTVRRRLPTGEIAEFTAREFWKENYAKKGRNNPAPNAMWQKRPYGQLAKCAEAQALRKAFPEIGAQPTAEELEGKVLDEFETIDASTGEIQRLVQMPQQRAQAAQQVHPETTPTISQEQTQSAERAEQSKPETRQQVQAPDNRPASESQKRLVLAKLRAVARSEVDLKAHFGFNTEEMPASRVNDVLAWLRPAEA